MANVLPANAAQAFLEALATSQIVSAEALAKIREQFVTTEDPKAVARALIAEGKVTKWQAMQLLNKFTGLIVGNYKLLDQLGVGELGRVYLAEHAQMQRKAALKVLHRKLTAQPQILRRILAEARRVAALEHPNISHIQDVNQDGERYFIVLEYVDAADLQRQVQTSGKLPAAQAWNVIRQAAEGLAHAHSQGIVHGGLKPSNLLLDKQGNVKILDFGLAQLAAGTDADSADSVDQAAATAKLYRAPEAGKQPADAVGDVYSLGASLYFLLTGKPPANGPASVADLVKEAPATTTEILELCTKLMSANPGDRPQNDQALLTAIDAAKPLGTAAKSAAPKPAAPAAKAPAIKTAAPLPTAKALPGAPAEDPTAAKAPPPKAKKPVVAKPLPSPSESQAVPVAAASESAAPAAAAPAEPAPAETPTDDNPFAGFALNTKSKKSASSGAMPALNTAAPATAKAPPAKSAPAKAAPAKAEAAATTAETPAEPATPAKKGKKGKGKAAANNMPLILAGGIGGGVLVLGLIVGLVIYLTSGGGDGKQVAKGDPEKPATASKEPGTAAGEANPATEANPAVEANPVIPAEANPVVPLAEANPKPAEPMPMATATPAVDPAAPKPEVTPEPSKPEPPMVAAVTPPKPEPPMPKPTPKPAPVGNPFVGFGKAVTLPKLPAAMSEPTPEMLASIVLGPCKLPDENTVVSMVLKGGETAFSKGKMKFTLQSANGGTSLRDWDIKVSGGLVETPITVAIISAKNDQLLFQWTAEAAKQAAAPYLCNCMVSMNAGTGKVDLALREPVSAEPIPIGIEKRNQPAKYNIDLPPEAKQLVFEILGVEGDVPKVKYDNKELTADKDTTFFWVGNVETEMPLGMKIDTSVTNSGRTVQVITIPHFKLEGMARPSMYAKRELQALSQNIESELQIGGAMIQQAALVQDAKKKGELSQAGTLKIEPAQKAKAQFEQMQNLAKGLQSNGKIKFRIYATAEDGKVELVNSDGAGAGAQPAAPDVKAAPAKTPAKGPAANAGAANAPANAGGDALPQAKPRAGAPKNAPPPRAPIGTQEATAEQIAGESRQLEGFDEKFKGKPFRITGTVEAVQGEAVVLQGGVTMTFAKKSDTQGIGKGGQVVIDGEYQQRGPNGPMFASCELVSK